MDFNESLKKVKDNGVDLLLTTGATVASLHVARKMPKYSGYVLLGAGIIGLVVGGKLLKTASIVTASLGVVNTLNALATENGVPAITGIKGTINKIVPRLNGLGDVEDFNENLLGEMSATDSVDLESLSGDNEELEVLSGGFSGLDSLM